jgi:hypothetical protein
MSFREKSAWITVITLLVMSLLFVLHLPPPWTLAPRPNLFMFHVLMLLVATFVVIEIVAHVVVALRAPRDARAPRDERDRLIALKARSLAYYVFAVLALGSVFLSHFGANQFGIAFCVLASFIVSQAVNYSARIVYYRRGI